MRNINYCMHLTSLIDSTGLCGLRNLYLLRQRDLNLPMVDPDKGTKEGREALMKFAENDLING